MAESQGIEPCRLMPPQFSGLLPNHSGTLHVMVGPERVELSVHAYKNLELPA